MLDSSEDEQRSQIEGRCFLPLNYHRRALARMWIAVEFEWNREEALGTVVATDEVHCRKT